jgi:acyl-CoA thioesterase
MPQRAAKLFPFDEAIQLEWSKPGVAMGLAHPAYMNMTGLFGGVTAATLLKGVLTHEACSGFPVSLTVNFCTPVALGPFAVLVRLARNGRSVQHWVMELVQNGAMASTATAITAEERDTFTHQVSQRPAAPTFETLPSLSADDRPPWISQYDMRFFEGRSTFQGNDDAPIGAARTSLWLRDRSRRQIDHLALAAMSDAFFPRLFHLRGRASPAGTVSLSTYFYSPPSELEYLGAGPIIGTAGARVFRNGFHDQTVELWSKRGALLAVSSQTVWFKD